MAQCKKILENGERCSNQAIPGAEYCDRHRRIRFRQVAEETARTDQGPQKRDLMSGPVARPNASGETPSFPGLRGDGRNILVAGQGLVLLAEENQEKYQGTLLDSLTRLLSGLSQETALAGHVAVQSFSEGAIVRLTPPDTEGDSLSRYYDMVAAVTGFTGGALYVGKSPAFIRYRDSGAPRGYDTENAGNLEDGNLYMVDIQGTHSVSMHDLHDEALDSLLLGMTPLAAHGAPLPETAFALAAVPLYRMLARYFRAHHLNYRVARLDVDERTRLVLFEITPRRDAPAGTLIPAFVLSYLTDLPRCAVFTEVANTTGRRMLVELRRKFPCLPRNILEVFGPDSLLLFSADPDFSNLCVSPSPAFFDGDDMVSALPPQTVRTATAPLSPKEEMPLKVSLRVVPYSGPTHSTAALILDRAETGWIRRLFHRLPGDVFSRYLLCPSNPYSVLVGQDIGVQSLPFGIPMRRVRDTQLFIPLRSRLVPELPWDLLAETLEIKENGYTFLAPRFRLDIPRKAFSPLSKALAAEPNRRRVAFDVLPTAGPPMLKWTEAPENEAPEREDGAPGAEKETGAENPRGFLKRLLKRPARPMERPEPQQQEISLGEHPEPLSETADGTAAAVDPPKPEPAEDQKMLFREHGETFQKEGDFLSAALCFGLAGDKRLAGQCYKEAASSIKVPE